MMVVPSFTSRLTAVLFFCWIALSASVDQSKFRTCDQTSFCRRHRAQHSSSLYSYRILPDSVQFHTPQEEQEEKPVVEEPKEAATGIWKSLQDRILGSATGSPDQEKDPYVKGPPPQLTGTLVNTATQTSTGKKETLEFSVHALADGVVRLRVTESYQQPGTPFEKARVTYDDLVLTSETMLPANISAWVPPGDPYLSNLLDSEDPNNYMALKYADAPGALGVVLLLRIDSFAAFLYREQHLDAGPIVTFGQHDQMHFEIRRTQGSETSDEVVSEEKEKEASDKKIVGYWEDGLAIYDDGTREERILKEDVKVDKPQHEMDREGLWQETFQTHKDSKPFGPMSVGADLNFPQSNHLYGIPEHASATMLKNTAGEGASYKDPFRLYNLDVFEYDLDVPMALYGAVPLVVSQSVATGTSAAFWFNPTETFVDVQDDPSIGGKSTHWMSESGIIDLFLLPGPNPAELYRQYSKLTGVLELPPMFSLGYHQCRWNYNSEQDVDNVHSKFEELDYPYDVLWLDIEHTNGKRYFTWDKQTFPTPKKMQEKLWSQGRRMVTIVDPHVKRDDHYFIHKEATAKGLYIKDNSGNKDYDGWCWPGSSSYLDFTNAKARKWWAEQFSYDKYKGSTPSLFTWNDMNEPSVFNGPEVSMQKDLRNIDGVEHREWHNLFGMLFHRSTGEGLIARNPGNNERPFVLSRSFFAGTQRYGAIWTGDNAAQWSHLEIATPMLLSLNVGAISFVGADVGGFFGDTTAELMTRWMQAGSYTPFFRGHAHHDAKRREPWMFDEATLGRLRSAAMARYALLPYWYTVFAEAGRTGMPIMRTMWMQYPYTEALFSIDDQYLVGADLMVKPVTAAGVVETKVKFPTDDVWYDAESLVEVSSQGNPASYSENVVPSDLDTIPVFQRGGSIIPRKLRLRRSSHMMVNDPYTLYVALDANKKAAGELYMDDETTFNHKLKDEYALAKFEADLSTSQISTLKNAPEIGLGWKGTVDSLAGDFLVERIVIMGMKQAPASVDVGGTLLGFTYNMDSKLLVIRKPELSALRDWEISIKW
eukprot:Nitzschia sp. Nitz4//scaffold3_size479765//102873//106087//NITZ4_000042-RA/size479765-augustus-gene-0.27-mRNA-1//-1//CDS//3329550584//3541//frame0